MQTSEFLNQLESFVVMAKSHTYVGGAKKLLPYRLGSTDIQFSDSDWVYHDSYVGESNFSGQEVVYFQYNPVWSMNYFGYILNPHQITSEQAGQVIIASLSKMYSEGRFLGSFEHTEGQFKYIDRNEGSVVRFQGRESIKSNNESVYELLYHGGVLRN
ncbi:MAG: DUF5680 domain-containing protein [Bacilli bacterium]